MIKCMLLLLMMGACLTLAAVAMAAGPEPLRLWAGDAPGAHGKTGDDIPTLTPYLPDPAKATGAAVLIIPGGGYTNVVIDHEGRAYAEWLNAQGIAGFVLLYRVGSHGYHHPVELQDATRALRTIRARAVEWKIDPHRVGVMGSSAGGHLASTLLTHNDTGDPKSADPIEREGSRPDLGILCYAVITMQDPNVHQGSRQNLLGSDPSPELIKSLSTDLQVTPQTPPCFVWSTVEDDIVNVENSMDFAAAMRRNKVPFDLHLYQHGGHGIGLGDDTSPFTHTHPWTKDLLYWLDAQKFLAKNP